MGNVRLKIRAVLFASTLLAGTSSLPAIGAEPDVILYNAHILTVDDGFSTAQAVAIEDGKFVKVGSDAEVLDTAGEATRKIDMKGKTILPGFNDSHVHMLAGKTFGVQVDLTRVRSIADIKAALAARIATARPGEAISGSRGWWEYQLSDGRLPNRHDLDEIAPNNPVAIAGPHYAIVNSLALKMAGITAQTPDPQGGEIYKDASGEPTGLLMDRASRPVMALFARPTPEQQFEGMVKVIRLANSNGLTSIGDPSGSVEDAALYRRLYDAGKLTLRVDFSYSVDHALPLDKVEAALKTFGPAGQAWGDGMFRADELGEVALDGAELSAFLRDGYPGKPDYHGIQMVPTEHFKAFAALANRYGWRLRPHAVGDAAIDEALDAFEFANAEKPITGRRWMIDHAFLLGPTHYPRVKALGVVINSQYMHNAQLGKLILKAWERPLADRSEPYREWLENGILFANGSDGPIAYDACPLYQIYGSVTRNTKWGGKLGPDQGISRRDAIKSVTINGAYTSFEEKVKGSIEPGKYADLVVLADDILAVPAENIKDIKILATVMGGRTVFGTLEQ
ncbi:amidohydrolase [Sphingomonas hengshuiensis]|uniref:Amidohydrolase 3 domain-containing protein n=1 Tax=Sphingomonas hengshuiensis TaxID=1609977 RepID=A0A7U5BEI3_9SPHN|nr:amidohydrolase [Sphingomonas hengshuiensis]AJP70797.1 hypothetical protein TS85_01635 [Sphingomonas hengshuiensis]